MQKVLFIGGGGYDGIIPIPDGDSANAGVLQRGYATIATDSGHSGSVVDASWALDDPEAVRELRLPRLAHGPARGARDHHGALRARRPGAPISRAARAAGARR